MKSKGIETIEQGVLCVLLNDSHAIIPVLDVLDSETYFGTELHRKVFGGIVELTKQATVPNVYTVSDKTGVPIAELQRIAAGFNTKQSKEVLYSAELIARSAQYRELRRAHREAGEVIEEAEDKGKNPNDVRLLCAEMMTVDMANDKEESPEVSAVTQRLDAEIAAISTGEAGIALSQRLRFLQDKTSGFRPGHIWMITAPYKGRKTTLLRNLIIDACRAGATVSMFALEGTETGTSAGLLAMLATEKLLTWGCHEEAHLSETFIIRGSRNEAQQQAITDARKELDGWRLRIYDARKGITNPERLMRLIKRDRFLFGMDVYALDYLQLLGEGQLFERMEASTHKLQQLTVTERVTALILAQLNEATIRETEESYSPGVKGGGDPAAASDFLIRTKYDGAKTPNILTVQLKLARHARPGTQRYVINAPSGLVIREDGKANEE